MNHDESDVAYICACGTLVITAHLMLKASSPPYRREAHVTNSACPHCHRSYAIKVVIEAWDEVPTHCEACGARLTPEEQATPVDPEMYRHCEDCQTSRV